MRIRGTECIDEGALFLFLVLNAIDASETALGLWLGTTEMMPLKYLASNIWLLVNAKILAACVVVWMAEKGWFGGLWWYNFIVFGAVFWNMWVLFILISVM